MRNNTLEISRINVMMLLKLLKLLKKRVIDRLIVTQMRGLRELLCINDVQAYDK